MAFALFTRPWNWAKIEALGARGANFVKGVGAHAHMSPVNAAIGAGVGAVTGAVAGGPDHRWSGGMAGAVGGAAVGGMSSSYMRNAFKTGSGAAGVGGGFARMGRRVERMGQNYKWS